MKAPNPILPEIDDPIFKEVVVQALIDANQIRPEDHVIVSTEDPPVDFVPESGDGTTWIKINGG